MKVSGQLHAPAALPSEKVLFTHWLLGWVGSRVGLVAMEKIKLHLCRDQTPAVQYVAPRYNDWAIRNCLQFLIMQNYFHNL
jgi:hypothetical protein